MLFLGGVVKNFGIVFDEYYNIDEDRFFNDLQDIFDNSEVKPKYVLVNFPHNPSSATITKKFYGDDVLCSKIMPSKY